MPFSFQPLAEVASSWAVSLGRWRNNPLSSCSSQFPEGFSGGRLTEALLLTSPALPPAPSALPLPGGDLGCRATGWPVFLEVEPGSGWWVKATCVPASHREAGPVPGARTSQPSTPGWPRQTWPWHAHVSCPPQNSLCFLQTPACSDPLCQQSRRSAADSRASMAVALLGISTSPAVRSCFSSSLPHPGAQGSCPLLPVGHRAPRH